MAKEAKSELAGAEPVHAAPTRSRKKLIVIITAALLLVVVVAAVLFVLLRSHDDQYGDEAEAPAPKAKVVKKVANAAPVYFSLEAFTVNLVPENGDQFLQVMMSVEVSDAGVGDRLKTYTPKLRNNIIKVLSGKKASELLSPNGKEKLASEIRDLINEILGAGKNNGADAPVKEVLFTSFIIQ
jgi:flagellar FliL protein